MNRCVDGVIPFQKLTLFCPFTRRVHEDRQETFLGVLRCVAPYLQELTLERYLHGRTIFSDFPTDIKFPKLTTLKIIFLHPVRNASGKWQRYSSFPEQQNARFINTFLERAPTLQEASFEDFAWNSVYNYLFDYLQASEHFGKIKQLNISGDLHTHEILALHLHTVNLTSFYLSLRNYCEQKVSSVSIEKILEIQRATLKELTLIMVSGHRPLCIKLPEMSKLNALNVTGVAFVSENSDNFLENFYANKLPLLEKLQVNDLNHVYLQQIFNHRFHIASRVNQLDLGGLTANSEFAEILKDSIRLFPLLHKIQIPIGIEVMSTLIAANMKFLEEISFVSCSKMKCTELDQVFTGLTQSQIQQFSSKPENLCDENYLTARNSDVVRFLESMIIFCLNCLNNYCHILNNCFNVRCQSNQALRRKYFRR